MENKDLEKAINMVNWSYVSKMLTGNRTVIRGGVVPRKYNRFEGLISSLLESVDREVQSWTDNGKKGTQIKSKRVSADVVKVSKWFEVDNVAQYRRDERYETKYEGGKFYARGIVK